MPSTERSRGNTDNQLEFWPDYDGLLWGDRGRAVALESLDLPEDLLSRITVWLEAYDDLKLPIDIQGDVLTHGNQGDPEWLEEGAELFRLLRSALAPTYRLVVTEPWWGVDPDG